MFKPIPALTLFAFSLFFATKAQAQTDSTYYDLGHLLIKKDFTQSITIKGSDLEKMPFSNLSEAVNVWFYGTYSTSSTLVYVIDGNMVNDVNAYNIHDIDEITLVQNAVVQLNGASGPQQLVLIKTKRNKPGKEGIEAAGQTSLVNTRNLSGQSGTKSETELYHDYYVSAYKNFAKSQFGVSVDYLRDVAPAITGPSFKVNDPMHYDRFRFNGYANAEVWKGSTLNFDASYTPQRTKSDITLISNNPDLSATNERQYYVIEHLVNLDLSLKSHLTGGLNNILSAGYDHFSYQEHDSFFINELTSPPQTNTSLIFAFNRTSNLELRDNLYYEKKVGDFVFEPSLNFTYRFVRDSVTLNSVSINNGNDPTGGFSQNSTSYYKTKTYFLTPSLNISYKNFFNIQGGFLYNLTSLHASDTQAAPPKLLPFVTTTFDIAHLVDNKTSLSIKLHGSYAESYPLGDGTATLTELNNLLSTTIVNNTPTTGTITTVGTPVAFGNLYNYYKTLTLGAEIDPFKGKLTLNYLFEKRNFVTTITEIVDNGSLPQYFNIGVNEIYYLHNININYKVISSRSFKWQTGLNATMIKTELPQVSATFGTGEWTGGFVNRFEFQNVFAGANLLYLLKEPHFDMPTFSTVKTNSFSLQNIYAGVRIKTASLRNLEIFANGRNVFQNKASDITDNRKFYGLGFKLGL